MSSLRIVFITLAAFASTAGVLTHLCLQNDPRQIPVKIVFVADEADEQRTLLLAGARAAASDHCVILDVETASAPSEDLPSCDGVVFAANGDESSALVDQVAATCRTVTVGQRANVSKPHCRVETGAYHVGRMLARVAREALPGGGKIALVVNAEPDSEEAHRLAAFQVVFKYPVNIAVTGAGTPQFELIECVGASGNVVAECRQALEHGGDAMCVVDFTGESVTNLVQSAAELASNSAVRLITLDPSDEALAAVEIGAVYAVVRHDPFAYGYHAVARLASLCRCDELGLPVPGRGGVYVAPVCVRRDNVAEFRDCLQPRAAAPAA